MRRHGSLCMYVCIYVCMYVCICMAQCITGQCRHTYTYACDTHKSHGFSRGIPWCICIPCMRFLTFQCCVQTFVFGEDVAFGGVFRATANLQDGIYIVVLVNLMFARWCIHVHMHAYIHVCMYTYMRKDAIFGLLFLSILCLWDDVYMCMCVLT